MTLDWAPLDTELAAWRHAGKALPLWWRDDDATRAGSHLQKLTALAEQIKLPVHLAIVPQGLQLSLVSFVKGNPSVVPLVHGYQHENRAPEGQKKAEFGPAHPDNVERARQGLALLRDAFGNRLVPVFVPPWNRIAPETIQALAELGYLGLSTYTARPAREAAPGLVQINTHLDPIDWRGGGGLVDPDVLITRTVDQLRDRRAGKADATEPFGLLTHHIVHDAAIWQFSESFLSCMLDGGAVPFDMSRCKVLP